MKNLILLIVLSAIVIPASGQKKKKKKEEEKVPVYNYMIDDPMDKFGRQPLPPAVVNTVLVPEFYKYAAYFIKDTLIKYECYDAANKVMLADTIKDYQQLRFVSVIRRYNDPVNTYKDSYGRLQPLPMEQIIYRYDKVGNDKWLSVDYATKKPVMLQEYPQDIVRTDSVAVFDPVKGSEIINVYKRYRVSPVK